MWYWGQQRLCQMPKASWWRSYSRHNSKLKQHTGTVQRSRTKRIRCFSLLLGIPMVEHHTRCVWRGLGYGLGGLGIHFYKPLGLHSFKKLARKDCHSPPRATLGSGRQHQLLGRMWHVKGQNETERRCLWRDWMEYSYSDNMLINFRNTSGTYIFNLI